MKALVWAVLLIAAGAGGIYLADRLVVEPRREMQRRIEERDRQIQDLKKKTEALEATLRVYRTTERRARIVVLGQQQGRDGQTTSQIQFTEIDSNGDPVGDTREFSLTGDEVYVDALVIKFQDELIEGADALRGKSLMLFRRLFTDRNRPADGPVLDREGQMPLAYATEKAPSAFERDLWAQFWRLANDPEEAKRHGVRAVHGDAVSIRLKKGGVYVITFRPTGELTIQPVR